MTNEEFQRIVLEKLEKLEKGQGKLETDVGGLKEGVAELKERHQRLEEGQKKLESGQENIMNLLLELDPKNADRHLEITQNISQIKEDTDEIRHIISKLEITTAYNSLDIAKLKSIK